MLKLRMSKATSSEATGRDATGADEGVDEILIESDGF
jgi:hypothetical protein